MEDENSVPEATISNEQDINESGDPAFQNESPPKTKKFTTPFCARFPGYPKKHFKGILPPCIVGPMTRPMGYPAYDYRDLKKVTQDIPFPNSLFQPINPDSMYVVNMPWCAYPYGVPNQRGFGYHTKKPQKKYDKIFASPVAKTKKAQK